MLRRVEEVVGYAIASVFTRSVSRRQGYASHMMRLLHWVLAPRHLLPARFPAEWGEAPTPRDWAGDAQFSILYSDVGPEFYTRCGPVIGQHSGWKVTGAVSTTWDVESYKDITSPCTTSRIEHTWLSAEECNSLWDEDSELIRSDLQGITSGNETVFAFLPSGGLGTWSIWKSMDFKDSQHYLPSDKWGIQLRPSDKLPAESLTFATWTYDIRVPPRTLVVTRLRATGETFGPLFSKIFEAAREQNVVMIEIWNVPRQLQRLADSLGGKTSSRTGHLPSMKWYEEEGRDGLIWSFNERCEICLSMNCTT